MRPVYVSGYSHLSALGDERGLARRIQAGAAPTALIELPVVNGSRLAYYRFADGADDRGPDARAAILRAMAGSGIDGELLRTSHCFIGSSSAGVDRREAAIAATGRVMLDSPFGLNDACVSLLEQTGIDGCYITFSTACTSSANALLAAFQMISAGQIEHAVVIGIETLNLTTLAGFHSLQLLAEVARPFDEQRSGIVLGEAVSAVVLSVHPHADYRLRILGGANHGDTTSLTGTDEEGESIARVISRALLRGGLQPADIGLIKVQAAGSPANDRAEAHGLCRVFSTMPAVTSVKPYLGHTLGASGCAELTLLLSCFRAGFAPATPNCMHPDPSLGILPLHSHAGVPRHTLLNFFGFGGNNTALVVEYGDS